MTVPLEVIIVDGYVALDAGGRPGLGAHLHAALGASVAVIGVQPQRRAAHADRQVHLAAGQHAFAPDLRGLADPYAGHVGPQFGCSRRARGHR